MNSNSNAIFTLCSHLCVGDNVAPLEPKEWGELAKKLMEAGLEPESIFELSKGEFKDKLLVSEEYADTINFSCYLVFLVLFSQPNRTFSCSRVLLFPCSWVLEVVKYVVKK